MSYSIVNKDKFLHVLKSILGNSIEFCDHSEFNVEIPPELWEYIQSDEKLPDAFTNKVLAYKNGKKYYVLSTLLHIYDSHPSKDIEEFLHPYYIFARIVDLEKMDEVSPEEFYKIIRLNIDTQEFINHSNYFKNCIEKSKLEKSKRDYDTVFMSLGDYDYLLENGHLSKENRTSMTGAYCYKTDKYFVSKDINKFLKGKK